MGEVSKAVQKEETYSLTDQSRRSSRSVCANRAEAWRKLSDAEAEVAETQVWIEFAVKCGYIERSAANELFQAYEAVIATIVGMINHPETWIIGG